MGVNQTTLWRWRLKHPEFLQACKQGGKAADERVERSFYQRAVGYERKAIKVCTYEGRSWDHEYVEEVLADPNAARFWLCNRDPDRWKEISKIEHNTPTDSPLAKLAQALAGTALRPSPEAAVTRTTVTKDVTKDVVTQEDGPPRPTGYDEKA